MWEAVLLARLLAGIHVVSMHCAWAMDNGQWTMDNGQWAMRGVWLFWCYRSAGWCWCCVGIRTLRVVLGHETLLVSVLSVGDELLLVLVLGVGRLDVLLCLQCSAVKNTVSDTSDESRVADNLRVECRCTEEKESEDEYTTGQELWERVGVVRLVLSGDRRNNRWEPCI